MTISSLKICSHVTYFKRSERLLTGTEFGNPVVQRPDDSYFWSEAFKGRTIQEELVNCARLLRPVPRASRVPARTTQESVRDHRQFTRVDISGRVGNLYGSLVVGQASTFTVL